MQVSRLCIVLPLIIPQTESNLQYILEHIYIFPYYFIMCHVSSWCSVPLLFFSQCILFLFQPKKAFKRVYFCFFIQGKIQSLLRIVLFHQNITCVKSKYLLMENIFAKNYFFFKKNFSPLYYIILLRVKKSYKEKKYFYRQKFFLYVPLPVKNIFFSLKIFSFQNIKIKTALICMIISKLLFLP